MNKGTNLDRLVGRLSQEELYNLYLLVSDKITNETIQAAGDTKGKVVPFTDYDQVSEDLMAEPDKMYGIVSGYSVIDEYTRGFEPGELIIVGAETGVGKSLLVQNMFHNMGINGIPNLFVSLEMPNGEADKRYKEMQMDVTGKSYRVDKNKLPLFGYEANEVDIESLDEAIGKAITDHGIKIVGIDHLHYFARSTDNASGEIGYLVRRFKNMARKYNIPFVVISHLKKLTKPGMPNLNSLRDSSFIAQDADCVIMAARDYMNEDPVVARTLMFEVQKNRTRGFLGGGRLSILAHYKVSEES